jgi:hypothetical protein
MVTLTVFFVVAEGLLNIFRLGPIATGTEPVRQFVIWE